jgi:hypothetical protein
LVIISVPQAQREKDKPRQGVVAITLNSFRNGAVGCIAWLGVLVSDLASNLIGCLSQNGRRVDESLLIQIFERPLRPSGVEPTSGFDEHPNRQAEE